MKSLIVTVCLAIGIPIACAGQITLSGHQLNIDEFKCKRGICTGIYNDEHNLTWLVFSKESNRSIKALMRYDQNKKNRAWLMSVEPKTSKKKVKSTLIGVDVDCAAFTTRIVHASVYSDFFCKGKTIQRVEEARAPHVPTPGSVMDATAGLVCTRLSMSKDTQQ